MIWDYFLGQNSFFRRIVSLSCVWVTDCLQNRAGAQRSGQHLQKDPCWVVQPALHLYGLIPALFLFQHSGSIASRCYLFCFLRTWNYCPMLNLYREHNNICSFCFFFFSLTYERAEAQWLILTQLRFFRRGKAEWGLKPVSPSHWFVRKSKKDCIDMFWKLSAWSPASQNIEDSLKLPSQAGLVSYRSGFLEQMGAVSHVTLCSCGGTGAPCGN